MRTTFIILAVLSYAALSASCSGRQSPEPAAGVNNGAGQPAAAQPTPTPEAAYVFRRKPAPASAAAPAEGAKLVEGKIQGLIVQKGEVKESPSQKDPSKTSYTVTYYLTNGSDISAVDEEGVHKESEEVTFVNVSQDGTPADDADAVEASTNQSGMPGMPVTMAFTAGGGSVVRVSGRAKEKRRTDADALLGEYKVDPATNKGRIYPEIKVETESGVVTIPVGSFVKFKKKPAAAAPQPSGKK